MFRMLAVIASLLFTGLSGVSTLANCKKVNDTQQCSGCANLVVELEERRIGSRVNGSVHLEFGTDSAEGVLAEVFTNTDDQTPLWNTGGSSQRKRVTACIVGKDGKFSFRLSPGKYELRFSLSPGWNCTYFKFEVVKHLRSKRLDVPMKIGT